MIEADQVQGAVHHQMRDMIGQALVPRLGLTRHRFTRQHDVTEHLPARGGGVWIDIGERQDVGRPDPVAIFLVQGGDRRIVGQQYADFARGQLEAQGRAHRGGAERLNIGKVVVPNPIVYRDIDLDPWRP